MTAQIKREIENLPEYKEKLSEITGVEIVDIQVQKNRFGKWEILYFWPDFWWFRKRSRIEYHLFMKMIKEI